jgi:hypothetical protein
MTTVRIHMNCVPNENGLQLSGELISLRENVRSLVKLAPNATIETE